jgi:ribosomal protein S18 acetylase RimI-like enzyme
MIRERIRLLEEIALASWPAAVVQPLDGWLLRFNDGVTRRANSVWPNGTGHGPPLPSKLAAVEAFYRERGLPPRYQISPASEPDDLDALLGERGYRRVAPTLVQTTLLEGMTAEADPGVVVCDGFDEDWFAAYCEAEHYSPHEVVGRGAILRRIVGAGFALLRVDGEPVAVGLGVRAGDWLGVFSMATRPPFRRRGAATAVLHALAHWGRGHGARQAYLQVMEDNRPALALYDRFGFRTLYCYHYRELPLGFTFRARGAPRERET